VTHEPKQTTPDVVPRKRATPAGEIRVRWAWVEAEVWTERMLTALEQGVIGGKWFSLMDKVYPLPNLRKAFARVKANDGAPGVDQATVEEFERHLEVNLEKLSRSLKAGSYRPQAIRREWIDKLGSKEKRPLGIPTVRDREVQAAPRAVATGLRLHPTKTRIIDAAQPGGFDFLGYHFERGYRWPRAKSLKKFKDTIRAKTRRTHGQSLSAIVTDLNRIPARLVWVLPPQSSLYVL
jgi:RNA-directed DNA polymerase